MVLTLRATGGVVERDALGAVARLERHGSALRVGGVRERHRAAGQRLQRKQ
jgi:hypothetical protein